MDVGEMLAVMLLHDQAVAWLKANGMPHMSGALLYRRNCAGTGPKRYRIGINNGYLPADLEQWVEAGAGTPRLKGGGQGTGAALAVVVSGGRERPRPIVRPVVRPTVQASQ